jgi:hypothetical protein
MQKSHRLNLSLGDYLAAAAVALVVVAVNARAFHYGWLIFDDFELIVKNWHLCRCRHGLAFAWTDVDYGRRYTPILWTVALIPGRFNVVGWHVMVVVLGALCSGLFFLLLRRVAVASVALPVALLFALSPLRGEEFEWVMGFVYCLVGIFGILGFLAAGQRWASVLCFVLAMLVYPQAAGLCLAAAALSWDGCAGYWPRDRVRSVVLVLVVLWSFLWQWEVRLAVGFVPLQSHWGFVPVALGHYVWSWLLPAATSPVWPIAVYWGAFLGLGVAGACFGRWGMWGVACILAWLPSALAIGSESLFFPSRYGFFLGMFLWVTFGWWVSRNVRGRSVALLWVAVFCSGVAYRMDRTYENFATAMHSGRDRSAVYGIPPTGIVFARGIWKRPELIAHYTGIPVNAGR